MHFLHGSIDSFPRFWRRYFNILRIHIPFRASSIEIGNDEFSKINQFFNLLLFSQTNILL